jgi:SAM-dependent methyltransferase
MGIAISQFGVFLSLREKIRDKKILSIGVQFPPKHKELVSFQKNFPELLSSSDLNLLSQTTFKNFQTVLFKSILGAKDLSSIDISADEGANYIWNMNEDISAESTSNELAGLGSSFDFIYDSGTMEHVSDVKAYLKNIFYLLKPNGIYCPAVPCSGYLEHGFFQFSPTFYADMCHANSPNIELLYLSVDNGTSNMKGLAFNSFYKDIDFSFPPQGVIKESHIFFYKYFQSTTIATGTLINVLNESAMPLGVMALIKKNNNFSLNMNMIQSIYRGVSLNAVIGNGDKLTNSKLKNKLTLKSFIIKLPLSSVFKYKLIIFILGILGKMAPEKSR